MPRFTDLAGSHDIPGDILGGLLPAAPVYQYRGRQKFLDTYYLECNRFDSDNSAREFVIFTNVDEGVFEGCFCNSLESVIIHSISAYDSTTHILVIKITTQEHARAADGFGDKIFDALRPRALGDSLHGFGGAKLYGDGQTRVPDKGWGPLNRPPYQSQQWPSLVVQVAVSQSRTKLQSDITFWLTKTYGQVNTIISIELARTRQQQIKIAKWVRDSNGQPYCDRQVTINKTSLRDKTPLVENGPLTIKFDQLFLRPRGPGERDVVLDAVKLGAIATKVWS